ncbi:hypothetical protein F443_02498 [Phytophthora nicotianae P1569]|uniref:Uncharacterized protein n=2 Tax=Phytophthora nicotianae TaxID=4792 RepID=V9FTE8_PHYNI|nr:hypothetical protein F443_02498 [Phytophthora nicotianae P1569]ETO83512.1 hypothetical protein F444_02489 [Phytophthora nicotianae P1976]
MPEWVRTALGSMRLCCTSVHIVQKASQNSRQEHNNRVASRPRSPKFGKFLEEI